MDEAWDTTLDVLVVGTGAAGLAAAIAAADAGLAVGVVESTDRWGGSSAMSGGGMWLPTNPLMHEDGVRDTREEALAYLGATVGDAGPAASPSRRAAFVDGVADAVGLLRRHGIDLARAADYPDYYPELPGGKVGRALEVEPFDRRRIGPWWETARAQDGVPGPIKTDDVWLLGRAWSTPSGFARGAALVGRTMTSLARGQLLVGAGAALACALLDVVLRQRTPVWLSTPLVDLVREDGRVVGAVVEQEGRSRRIHARRGVVLAGGGFAHRTEWRQQHHGIAGDSSASRGDLGTVIEIGHAGGGALDLMDDAWWGASVPGPAGGQPMFLVGERSMPFSLIIDSTGQRFANESESYVDLGHRMLERRGALEDTVDESGEVRFWMVSDVRHSRRYLRTYALDPRATAALREEGRLHTADSITELAAAIGVDPGALTGTVERFNGFARAGVDDDFGRGNSAYDRYYSDPLVHPNPNLGPLERGPFTAVEVVIGDLGTKGGLVTDEDARVVDDDGRPIPGLYGSGNCTASVMGRTYPGPGSTLGPAIVFGALAARHAAATTRATTPA